MPYKHKEKKIPRELDRRCKLTEKQKKDIKNMYESGNYSQRELARLFSVSRRLIVFIIYPERLEKNSENRKKRGGSKLYYDVDKFREYMKSHRQHKQLLYLQNKLI